MIKKLIVAMILIIFTLEAKEPPSINETISFIQKVIKDDSLSSNVQLDKLTYYKPNFKHLDQCKFEITQKVSGYNTRLDKIVFHNNIIYADISIQEISLNDILGITIEDRDGLKTVKLKRPHTSNELSIAGYAHFEVHGVYKEKFKKALNHLSKECYKKYGKKNDEPF